MLIKFYNFIDNFLNTLLAEQYTFSLDLPDLLNLSTLLFLFGIFGIIFIRTNLLMVFICLELMLIASSLNFLFVSFFYQQPEGLVICIFLLSMAATEMAVGLTLLVFLFRLQQSINFDKLNTLKN